MRKLILFGNGLGRSLDNDFFDLGAALQHAWDDPDVLDDVQRALIQQCLPSTVLEDEVATAPKREEELDRLQRVLAPCDEISKHEIPGEQGWLSDHGRSFPFAIRSYIHSVASYFHSGDHALPNDFVSPLVEFIKGSRSHVATLNYDELLYRSFIGSEVFSGYNCLLDGFVPDFDASNLDRFYPNIQSYYLHLHGSPLYYTSNAGGLHKANLSALPNIQGYASTHIVLTHVDHKSSVINASPILREYWQRLAIAMSEVDGIVLFGYGGGDTHLNGMISRYFREKQVEVVERSKPEYADNPERHARFNYWKQILGVPQVYIFWHENILFHKNWSWQKSSQ